ncbi:orexin receptor type 2-like [Scylla paramamosain]|uniref:orexin receptor type 2-like n=1 Tax=Scylla paramamosain TaxID=85552 RepID=UPI003083BED4
MPLKPVTSPSRHARNPPPPSHTGTLPARHTAGNVFASLAHHLTTKSLARATASLVLGPLCVPSWQNSESYTNTFPLPTGKLVPFVEYCVSHASVLTILVISFERYYAICRPLRASYTCTKMRACTCILTIWAAAVLLSSPMLVMSKYLFVPYADGTMVHGCYTELTTFWSCLYINLVTAVFFFVPLVLLVLLYLVIGRSLMRDSASAALQHRKVDLPNMKARKQVVVMLATVTVFFFVSLFPFRVLTLWIVWTPQETIETIGPLRYFSFLYGTRVLFFANSAVNPILYNLTSTKFREAFLKLLGENRGDSRRHLSRQSTFNTTGTSMSNGRSGSSRTIPTDLVAIKESYPHRVALARCGRQVSTDDFSSTRPSIARYGRQSSFAGSYCFTSTNSATNSASCSRQNSRAGDHCVYGPEEVGRRLAEGEKRHSGEGRRLLEGDRPPALTDDMIEEERSSGATVRGDSLRRSHEKKIESEMEQLLAEGNSGPQAPGKNPATASPSSSLTQPSTPRDAEEGDAGGENGATEKSSSTDKENVTEDAITTGENGKSVQFSDRWNAESV